MQRIDSHPRTFVIGLVLRATGAALVLGGLLGGPDDRALGGDWPQARYDAGRGAATPEELSPRQSLLWDRQLPAPRPAWPASQPSLRYDASYQPVAADGLLFVPSMVSDSVTAYELATGKERWCFYSEGPVRFAPIAHRGRLYFGSDDGFLYCLDASRGELIWKVRGGPYQRQILGNGRLIATWPIRTGPVLLGDRLVFSAGLWPFMGIFVHAIDPDSGAEIWTASGDGADYQIETHKSPSFSGFVPHGYLAATSKGMVAAGCRTQPACYDLATGKLRWFGFGDKRRGDFEVIAWEDWYLSDSAIRHTSNGELALKSAATVCDQGILYGIENGEVFAGSPNFDAMRSSKADAKGKLSKRFQATWKSLWKFPLPADSPSRLFLKAGSCLVLGGERRVAILKRDPASQRTSVVWQGAFEGQPWTMLVADRRLVVVTTAGRIYCFGPQENASRATADESSRPPAPQGRSREIPEKLARAAVGEGYGLLVGLRTEGLARDLVQASKLHWIALDRDVGKVDALRRQMDGAGLYGTRLAAIGGSIDTAELPPYLADAIVVDSGEKDLNAAKLAAAFQCLRPYGGTAWLPGVSKTALAQMAESAGLEEMRVAAAAEGSLLVRTGPLPGAGAWTHQYADAGNSNTSTDRLVRAPLGLLWFGGPSHDDVLPRHGHGPAPQVAAGRLFIEGPNMLRALDVYTGRLLWQRQFEGLGRPYDNTQHQPGANEIGSNYASSPDRVYVAHGDRLLILDAATGQTENQLQSAPGPDGRPTMWGFVGCWQDLLIAATEPVVPASRSGEDSSKLSWKAFEKDYLTPTRYASGSRRLVVFDRRQGQVLWSRDAKYRFRHNAIVAGSGRIYCLDSLPSVVPKDSKKSVISPPSVPEYQPSLTALETQTGQVVWQTTTDVFGTFLNYSSQYDVLLQAGSNASDRARDEVKVGMAAYQGKDGKVLWKDLKRTYSGPCLLRHDTIITQGKSSAAFSLLTGQSRMRSDPLTGQKIPWSYTRGHGCNTVIGSEHLLTFRSSAAGYFDLARNGGTGNLGGFKSGCTSNLIVADGVLCAPDYTRTCICPYQNQTSLALVHDPRVEMWTYNPLTWTGQRVRRVGINFGAPGDRVASSGTLWLDYPSVGGPSPELPIQIEPVGVQYYRHHSGRIRIAAEESDARTGADRTAPLAWVAASGAKNLTKATLTLCTDKSPETVSYMVRLHFAEIEPVAAGARVFNIRLQGKQVAAAIDLARQAGPWTAAVKTFRNVRVADRLTIELEPQSKMPPILSGVEVVLEE